MREAEIENYAIQKAQKEGWLVRKVQWVGCNAAPDRYFSKEGREPFFVEFKAPGKKLREDQQWEVLLMRAKGTLVEVWDSKEKVDAFPW
jgi:hypothetical protein